MSDLPKHCIDSVMKFCQECKYSCCIYDALEKQISKKPNIYGDSYDDNGNLIYDTYDCPNCKKSYEIDYEKYNYCPCCGQAFDWSD